MTSSHITLINSHPQIIVEIEVCNPDSPRAVTLLNGGHLSSTLKQGKHEQKKTYKLLGQKLSFFCSGCTAPSTARFSSSTLLPVQWCVSMKDHSHHLPAFSQAVLPCGVSFIPVQQASRELSCGFSPLLVPLESHNNPNQTLSLKMSREEIM